MLRILLTFSLLSASAWFFFFKAPSEPDFSKLKNFEGHGFFDNRGHATEALKNLLSLTKAPKASDHSLPNVFKQVQGKLDPNYSWLRPRDKERWETDAKRFDEQGEKILTLLLNDLKLNQGRMPTPQEVQNVKGYILFGSTLQQVRKRLSFLNHLIETKILSGNKPLYLVCGERKLSVEMGETQDALFDPKNEVVEFQKGYKIPTPEEQKRVHDEGDMMKAVAEQSADPSLKVQLVYSKALAGAPRATTESTLKPFFEGPGKEGGLFLAFSNEPFVLYQQLVTDRCAAVAKTASTLTVLGPSMTEEEVDQYIKKLKGLSNMAAILVDNAGRIIYELKQKAIRMLNQS